MTWAGLIMYACMYACILSSAGPQGLGGPITSGGRAAAHGLRDPVRNRPTPTGGGGKEAGVSGGGGYIYRTSILTALGAFRPWRPCALLLISDSPDRRLSEDPSYP